MRRELHLGVCVVLSRASGYDCVHLTESLQQTTLTSASRTCLVDHDSCVMERDKAQRCVVNCEVAAADSVREGVTWVAGASWPAKQAHHYEEQCSFA